MTAENLRFSLGSSRLKLANAKLSAGSQRFRLSNAKYSIGNARLSCGNLRLLSIIGRQRRSDGKLGHPNFPADAKFGETKDAKRTTCQHQSPTRVHYSSFLRMSKVKFANLQQIPDMLVIMPQTKTKDATQEVHKCEKKENQHLKMSETMRLMRPLKTHH